MIYGALRRLNRGMHPIRLSSHHTGDLVDLVSKLAQKMAKGAQMSQTFIPGATAAKGGPAGTGIPKAVCSYWLHFGSAEPALDRRALDRLCADGAGPFV